MLASIPLLIVPFVLYNLGLAGLFGQGVNGDPWADTILSVKMMSGGTFSMTLGDLMVLIGLAFFFVEILKSTRTSNLERVDPRSPSVDLRVRRLPG